MTTPTSSSLPPPTPPPPKARALFRALLSVIFSYDPSAGWWSGVGWGGGWGGGGASSHAAVVPLAAQLLLLLLSRPGRFGAGEGAGGGGAGGGGTRGGGTEDRMSSLLSGLHGAETLGFICRGFSRLLGHRFVASAAYLPSLNSSKADTVRCVPELLALLWRYLSSNEGFVHATLESSESLPSLLLSLSLIALEGAADATAVSLVHMSTLCLLLLSTEAKITHTRHCFLPPPPRLPGRVRVRPCVPVCHAPCIPPPFLVHATVSPDFSLALAALATQRCRRGRRCHPRMRMRRRSPICSSDSSRSSCSATMRVRGTRAPTGKSHTCKSLTPLNLSSYLSSDAHTSHCLSCTNPLADSIGLNQSADSINQRIDQSADAISQRIRCSFSIPQTRVCLPCGARHARQHCAARAQLVG